MKKQYKPMTNEYDWPPCMCKHSLDSHSEHYGEDGGKETICRGDEGCCDCVEWNPDHAEMRVCFADGSVGFYRKNKNGEIVRT